MGTGSHVKSFGGTIRGGFDEPLFYSDNASAGRGRVLGKTRRGAAAGDGSGKLREPRKRIPYRGRRKKKSKGVASSTYDKNTNGSQD